MMKSRASTWWRTLSLLLVVSMVLAACADDDGGEDPETTEVTDTTASEEEVPDTEAPDTDDPEEPEAEVPDSGDGDGVLTVASVESIDNWDPLAQANPSYMKLVYDTLLGMDPEGLEFEPQLATEWEQTDEYIELTLRDDAVFHDGTPVDAAAIELNIERMRDTAHAAQAAFANVTDVVAVDDLTVQIELSEPTAGILEELAGFVGSIAAPASIDEGNFEEPIGSAAWVYNAEESVPGSEVVVDAFADYYAADEVGPDRIVYLEVFDTEQRYNALQTGAADVIYGTGALADRAGADGYDVATYPKVQWAVMMTDLDVFSDLSVRQAVCHAIDPQQFLDAQFDGYGATYGQLFLEGAAGYNPDISAYEYDVARAQELMEDAGNPSIQFELPTSDEYQAVAQVFAAQMAEIGITVDLNVMPFGEYFGAYNTGDSPVILFSTAADTGPYSYFTRRYAASAGLNPAGNDYGDLLSAVQEGAAASEGEADEHWMEFSRLVLEEAHDCGHFGIPGIWISNPDTVSNVVPTVNQIDAFRYMEADVSGG